MLPDFTLAGDGAGDKSGEAVGGTRGPESAALTHSGSIVLTDADLAVWTNADESDDAVRVPLVFRLVAAFKHGQLERMKSTGAWQKTSEFTRWELGSGRVRYVHLAGTPDSDEASVRVSLLDSDQQDTEHTIPALTTKIRVSFVDLGVVFLRNEDFVLHGSTHGSPITKEILSANTYPTESEEHNVVYILESNPLFGTLELMTDSSHNTSERTFAKLLVSEASSGEESDVSASRAFSQEHVDRGLVWLTMNPLASNSASPVKDEFRFHVEIRPGNRTGGNNNGVLARSPTATLKIVFIPKNESSAKRMLQREVVKELQVLEGSKKPVDSSVLWLEVRGFKTLEFTVVRQPSHGLLVSASGGPVSIFRSDDLLVNSRALSYDHDGSETTEDSFQFIAKSGENGFFYFGELKIAIQLRNDNPPVSVNHQFGLENVLEIVRGGRKTLSRRNLHFTDSDTGTSASDLLYKITDNVVSGPTSRGKLSPGFHTVDDIISKRLTKVSAFTQQQVDSGLVTYVDDGLEPAKTVNFLVSDGEFRTEDRLRILASDPFVRLDTNTGLVVPSGSTTVISGGNLTAYANSDVTNEKLVYAGLELPSHGDLLLRAVKLKPGGNFTQQASTSPRGISRKSWNLPSNLCPGDSKPPGSPMSSVLQMKAFDIELNALEYRHKHVVAPKAETSDSFAFALKDTSSGRVVQGRFEIKVLPRGYWAPLVVKANATILVEEPDELMDMQQQQHHHDHHQQQRGSAGASSITRAGYAAKPGTRIGKQHLNVAHRAVAPRDVVFSVMRGPAFGVLRLVEHNNNEGIDRAAEEPVRRFDQAAINAGSLIYEPRLTDGGEDFILFDVTNGITVLPNLLLKFVMVPKFINMDIDQIFLSEGQSQIILAESIRIVTLYYADKVKEFIVDKSPSHGCLELVSAPGKQITTFTARLLNEGVVQYTHDGSELLFDEALIVARAMDGRESALTPMVFNITQVNDQPPRAKIEHKNQVKRLEPRVWQGGLLPITSDILAFEDEDTPNHSVVYNVESVEGGELLFLQDFSMASGDSIKPPGHDDDVKVESLLPAMHQSPTQYGLDGAVDRQHIVSVGNSGFMLDFRPVLQFTQAQVTGCLLIFKHTGGNVAGFKFAVTDGAHVSQTHSLRIYVEKLLMSIKTKKMLEVFPLSSATLGTENIEAILNDPIGPDFEVRKGIKLEHWNLGQRKIIYKVDVPPKLGKLVLGNDGNRNDTKNLEEVFEFSQQDVGENRLIYIHGPRMVQNGDKQVERNDMDSFEIKVMDEKLGETARAVVHVAIGLSGVGGGLVDKLKTRNLIVEEGAIACLVPEESVNVTPLSLFIAEHLAKMSQNAASADSNVGSLYPLPKIVVKLMDKPKHGAITENGRSLHPRDGSPIELPATSLSEGLICYVHDHSDTRNDSIPLGFFLRKEQTTPMTDIRLFNASLTVNIDPVNDQPFTLVTKPSVVAVVQGMTATLSPENVLTTDPDTPPEGISYQIVDGPKLGRLRMELPQGSDIYSSITLLQHPSSGDAKLGSQHDPAAEVDLDLSPGSSSSRGTGLVFTQADINAGVVKYDHGVPEVSAKRGDFTRRKDAFGLTPDAFYFKVWDGHFKPVFQRVHVKIVPLLMTLKNHRLISIKQGSTVASISKDQLSVDTNGDRNKVFFNITKPPKFGKILVRDNGHEKVKDFFTQADIDADRVIYLQADINAGVVKYDHGVPEVSAKRGDFTRRKDAFGLTPDAFYFKVWDGHFKPVFQRVHVKIVPLLMTLKNHRLISIKQGSTVASISKDQLSVDTNGDRNKVFFNITKPPKFGKILVRDNGHEKVKDFFTQADIDADRVIYLQVNMSSHEDGFALKPFDFLGDQLPEIYMKVKVQPLLMTRTFNITFGEKYPLTTAVLSASQLGKMMGSDPVFVVKKKPLNAKIKISTKGKTDADDKTAEKRGRTIAFSQSDLRERRIYLISRPSSESNKQQGNKLERVIVNDSLVLLITSDGVQPAEAELKFHIVPRAMRLNTQQSRAADSVKPNEEPNLSIPVSLDVMSNPSITKDSWIVACVVAGIVCLSVLVIVVAVKCVIAGKKSTPCGSNCPGKLAQQDKTEAGEVHMLVGGSIVQQEEVSDSISTMNQKIETPPTTQKTATLGRNRKKESNNTRDVGQVSLLPGDLLRHQQPLEPSCHSQGGTVILESVQITPDSNSGKTDDASVSSRAIKISTKGKTDADDKTAEKRGRTIAFSQSDLRERRIYLISRPSSESNKQQGNKLERVIVNDSLVLLITSDGVQPAEAELKFHIVPRAMRLNTQQSRAADSVKPNEEPNLSIPVSLDVMSNPSITKDSWIVACVVAGIVCLSVLVIVVAVKCVIAGKKSTPCGSNCPGKLAQQDKTEAGEVHMLVGGSIVQQEEVSDSISTMNQKIETPPTTQKTATLGRNRKKESNNTRDVGQVSLLPGDLLRHQQPLEPSCHSQGGTVILESVQITPDSNSGKTDDASVSSRAVSSRGLPPQVRQPVDVQTILRRPAMSNSQANNAGTATLGRYPDQHHQQHVGLMVSQAFSCSAQCCSRGPAANASLSSSPGMICDTFAQQQQQQQGNTRCGCIDIPVVSSKTLHHRSSQQQSCCPPGCGSSMPRVRQDPNQLQHHHNQQPVLPTTITKVNPNPHSSMDQDHNQQQVNKAHQSTFIPPSCCASVAAAAAGAADQMRGDSNATFREPTLRKNQYWV
ncbi:unnamed protein product [Notodromas monacha]|uniref:Uncharacterized protein n=1 Tax=Notodromas monacha TaxID=399045 RepID=A0A7R9BQK3_9CRUS|nr:unnamed protein product [Notodromas monacha]CAG0918926.1 unnamed protein product [Notodromas monacha]